MQKLEKKEEEELERADKSILNYITSLPLKPKSMSIREEI
jgi:hypothetical protein